MDEKEKELELENAPQEEDNTAPEQEDTTAEEIQEDHEDIPAEKTQAEQESTEAEPEEGDSWQFDGSAPTLEGNLDIGSDYEIDVAEESEAKPEEDSKEATEETPEEGSQEDKEAPEESGDEIHEYKQEPLDDDDEEEKEKRNFIVNKIAIKITLIAVVCAVVLAIIAFFGVRFFTYPNSSEIMTPGNLALTVDNTKVSVGYYNYYYNMTVNNYIENAQSGYLDLKVGEDYSAQFTTDENGDQISWEQKFRDDTIWQIQYLTAYYEAALEAGVTLTDEQKESIETSITNIENNAAQLNQSVKAYLAENAGEYCGVKTMRTIYERLYIAQSYFSQMNISLSASDEEIQKAVEENQDEYKAITFAYIEMPYTEEDNVNALKAKADEYCAEVKSLTDMKNLIPEVCAASIEQYIAYGYAADEKEAVDAIAGSMQHTFNLEQFKTWFPGDVISDWLYSNDTAVGSVAAFIDEDYSCIDILYKLSGLVLDETEKYSVRHILIMPHSENESEEDADSADNEYTKEEWAKALEEANRILDEYNATDKTEIDFAELAEKYSEDVSSTSSGGYGYYGGQIFEAGLGEMVPEFEAWGTDPSRQYGDVGIVKSQYGYHIMYYVYSGPLYMFNAKANADALKQDEFVDSFVVTEHDAMDKTTVATAE